MLEKNSIEEIYLKINTCKIINIKKKICLIDILGNTFFINIHIIIDKPRIYTNPYFLFNNNVSIFPKNNSFVLSNKSYHFDRVLIGKNIHLFKDIIQIELKEEFEENIIKFIRHFEGIYTPKLKILSKLKTKNVVPNIDTIEKGNKNQVNNIDIIRNKDILKNLYKHIQIINFFNYSHFDCFVELSFESKLNQGNKDILSLNEMNESELFLSFNDFYVYPSKFFLLSKKCKKIILLFLPKNVQSYEERLFLYNYSIKDEPNESMEYTNNKQLYIKGKKELNKNIDKSPNNNVLSNDNIFCNNINNILSNKIINNYIYDMFSFVIKGEGIQCYLKIEPEYINFHKVLLNSVQKKNIEIKNRSYCDIIWYIDSNSIKDNSFYINPTRGTLNKNERKKIITIGLNTNTVKIIKKEIKIYYSEAKVNKNDKVNVNNLCTAICNIEADICISFIQVNFEIIDEKILYDHNHTLIEDDIKMKENNFLKEYVTILKNRKKDKWYPSKELLLNNVIENVIQMKYVPVNEAKICLFKIKNTGKVGIHYFVEINDETFLQYITINDIYNIINMNEEKEIKLKIKSYKKIKFQNIDLFIHICDSIENNYIQSYKYILSVSFDYNYLKIVPHVINYDSVEIKKEETKIFKIINDGYFDFKYDIKLLKGKIKNNKYQNENFVYHNKENNKNFNKIIKNDNEANKNPFKINPMSGLIKSKEEQVITVVFYSEEENYYKYIYIVQVENLISSIGHNNINTNITNNATYNKEYKKHMKDTINDTDKYNEIIKLFACSVRPKISCDIKNLFEEMFILNNLNNYNHFVHYFLTKNSYYNVEENTLYYKYGYVNEYINERIKISNLTDVNTNIKIEMKEIDFSSLTNKSKKNKEAEKNKKNETNISPNSAIKYNLKIQNYNEEKYNWNCSYIKNDNLSNNINEQFSNKNNIKTCASDHIIIYPYQHKFIDICFHSTQIACKKFLFNIYMMKPEHILCYSFYINIEFFLPSAQLIIPSYLLKLTNNVHDKVIDIGNIHINSVLSFKIQLMNSFKYPVMVKVIFHRNENNHDNIKNEFIRNLPYINQNEENNIILDKKENVSIPHNNLYRRQKEDENIFTQQNKKLLQSEIKKKNILTSDVYQNIYPNEKNIANESFNNNIGYPRVEEKKELYNNITNNDTILFNIHNMKIKKKNNITYFNYENVKDIIYNHRCWDRTNNMYSIGYLCFIGNINNLLRENEVAYFKIKLNKNKLKYIESNESQNETNPEQIHVSEKNPDISYLDNLNKKENKYKNDIDITNVNGKNKTNNINKNKEDYKNNNDNEKKNLDDNSSNNYINQIEKTNDLSNDEKYKKKKKKDKNVQNNNNIYNKNEKKTLGNIQIKILNNNYECYNLKFIGNIIERKNYWNLKHLKHHIKKIYNNNFYIFKNHINFDIVPLNFKHTYKLLYINENNHTLFFHIEVDKKIKNIIDIKPINGSIPSSSSLYFYFTIDVKELVNFMDRPILCKFSQHEISINKKNIKLNNDNLKYDEDDLYISLRSEEIKVSYKQKKIHFKNIPLFNYSKYKFTLENTSNVKLFAELSITPNNYMDDILSTYSFEPFKEKHMLTIITNKATNTFTYNTQQVDNKSFSSSYRNDHEKKK